MSIRRAQTTDTPAFAALSSEFRDLLQTYSPVFWRKASNAEGQHASYLASLLEQQDYFGFVYEDGAKIDGFILARISDAPPVYSPGGPVCIVDDYTVRSLGDWETKGLKLLEACQAEAKVRGAVLLVVISPQKHIEKSNMLQNNGVEVASEWRVKPL